MKIVAQTYEEARLEYFKERKAACERKLQWYKDKKPGPLFSEEVLYDKCSEYGQKISFYADAIERFGGKKK